MYKLSNLVCLLQILCHAAHLTYIKEQMASFCGSKLHKSEQKLFIMTGRWYCRQKWPLTLWKYDCNGLTEAALFLLLT